MTDLPPADDADLLDAYSAAVVRVAEAVLPGVASLQVRGPRGGGSGSASVLTSDGYLLTSAHVVEGASRRRRVLGRLADHRGRGGRDPLSDLAVLLARGDVPAPVVLGDAATLRWASWSWRSATRSGCPHVTAGIVSALGGRCPPGPAV